MTRSVLLPGVEGVDPPELLELAAEGGYDGVWAGELWGADAFVRLTALGERHPGLRLGTAIVNVYSRTPATLAQAAASLADLTGERFRLGLGPSTSASIEGLHGRSYDRPVRRLHETAEAARALAGDGSLPGADGGGDGGDGGDGRVTYHGDLVTVSDVPPLGADVSVYAAALGPAARRATGRVADGWLPHNVPFPDLADAFGTVADTAAERGRDPDAITVAPYVPTVVDEDESRARDLLRGHVAYYVGSGEGYRRAVGSRFPDAAERIADRWAAGDRDAARAAITDEMLAALGVAGTPGTAPERFRAVADRPVVDEPIVVVPAQADADTARRTIRTLAPDGEA